MFGSAQSFLAFLVALATVCGAVRIFGLNYIVQACRDFARQMGTFGCALFLCAFVMLAGFAVSKEPMRSSPSPMMPEWFSALGYNVTDTDGDGIPDCWERWTRTNPRVADDTQDMDGDGVDNYAEFWHQCDPALADTDGDGYSDYVEIVGQAVGKTWYDPLVRATYVHDEPDTNANGVPDHWEGSGYVYGFTDANGDELPDNVPFPAAGGDNFDVAVTVTTSRSALLTWGDGVTNGIVLAPCTGLVVRVRIAKAVETNIRLAAGLPNDGSDGLWDASYSVTWASGRNQQTEGNRIRLGDGSIIDIDGEATVPFRGEVVSVPMRGPGGDYPPSPIPLRLKWLNVNCTDGLCWEHDPGGFSAVAVYTNVVPPFAWYVNGYLVPNVYGDILGGYYIFNHWDGLDSPEVRCVATNGPLHEAILVEDSDYAGMGHCPPGATNLFPITELVGYDVVTNHAPDKTDPTPAKYGPNCPETETLDIWAGFAHGGAKPWARNFETIPTGNDDDDATSHCHAIDWSDGLEIDLEEYLPGWLLKHRDKLRFRVDGSIIDGSKIKAGTEEPEDLFPEIHHAELCTTNGVTLDRLWIVMLNTQTRSEFSTWASENPTNAAWLGQLPKPPSKIFVDSEGNATLPSAASASWNAPEHFPPRSYMHPKAVYELRSKSISGGHGHQATYDTVGNLITESIKAGTADIATPYPIATWWRPIRHREKDVKPYIRALQLDGNPIIPIDTDGTPSGNFPRNISRPPLRVDSFIRQYLQRRPTTPTGVLEIP